MKRTVDTMARWSFGSRVRLLAGAVLMLVAVPAFAAVLITPREGKLPDDDTVTRGVFSGPKVVLVTPNDGTKAVSSPVDLVVQFEPRGGIPVDVNSLSVTYMKSPPVDLTERVKEFVTPTGISMPAAEMPPGHHRIEIEIKDADGRVGGREVTLDVTH